LIVIDYNSKLKAAIYQGWKPYTS